jgi:hypothetical protein
VTLLVLWPSPTNGVPALRFCGAVTIDCACQPDIRLFALQAQGFSARVE